MDKPMTEQGIDRLLADLKAMKQSSAYLWGRRAYNLGASIDDNQCTPGSKHYTDWANGWMTEHNLFMATLRRLSKGDKPEGVA